MSEEEQYRAIELQKTSELAELLESRHILDDEIKTVIHNAEATKKKLYQPESNRFLAKMRIGNVTFYVEYSPVAERTHLIHTAYCHRAEPEE